MVHQELTNYHRIARSIDFIREHFKDQPDLETVASHVGLSPFHFQRLFSKWAGISPKKFLQYTSIQYAKKLLKESQSTLFDTACASGLSGTSRLHDLFVTIEGMTPGEFKNGGENLKINYCFSESPFGKLIIASTEKGICHTAFTDNETVALTVLENKFPNASFSPHPDPFHQPVMAIFNDDRTLLPKIKLHLKGTAFQLKIWELLLQIPAGKLATYGSIARKIGKPKAARAVGTAIGDNPVAFIIPCHRVIQQNGALGGYHWGPTRKTIIIGWEAAHHNKQEELNDGLI